MAQNGDQESLEWLVRRHSPWIYNIALRLLYHPDDAQDASQEILVKVITRLSTFEGRSGFRTWLYRIALNHLLTMKRLRRERWTFEAYGRVLEELPERELVDSTVPPRMCRSGSRKRRSVARRDCYCAWTESSVSSTSLAISLASHIGSVPSFSMCHETTSARSSLAHAGTFKVSRRASVA